MANQGAKKRKEENTRHMAKLLRLIIACNVIYVIVRMLFFHSTFTWKHWVGLFVTSVAYLLPYKQLAQMANPSFTDDGELLDGGFDMSTGGVCGYLHDVIYITSFVQLMSIISGKFWYTYLVIPAFGAYKLFGLSRGFMSGGSQEGVEDEKSRKKREKMEKKASRPKFVTTRGTLEGFSFDSDEEADKNPKANGQGNEAEDGNETGEQTNKNIKGKDKSLGVSRKKGKVAGKPPPPKYQICFACVVNEGNSHMLEFSWPRKI